MNYEDAVELAYEKHEGQVRKWTGEPYISHPLAVAAKFDDEVHKIVAVLHDVFEDTDMTMNDFVVSFDPNTEVVLALSSITRYPDQPYLDYILQIKRNWIATGVKIEDLKHNMSNLKGGNLKDKYLMALHILTD